MPHTKAPAEESAEVFLRREESENPPSDDRKSWPIILIVVGLSLGLVATGIGWAGAHQRGQELDAKLRAATGHLEAARRELSSTRSALEARRAHYSRVREGVGALTLELQALSDLLSEDPEVAP